MPLLLGWISTLGTGIWAAVQWLYASLQALLIALFSWLAMFALEILQTIFQIATWLPDLVFRWLLEYIEAEKSSFFVNLTGYLEELSTFTEKVNFFIPLTEVYQCLSFLVFVRMTVFSVNLALRLMPFVG